jgi:glycogen(starch) synthase
MSDEKTELPKKILMTADAVGGVWQYTVDLCASLSRVGVEVLVATLGPAPTPEQSASLQSIPGVRTVHGDYSLEWMPEPWRDVDQAGEWLLELQENFTADLVHLNGFSHAALPWQRPVMSVGHSCVRSWWRAVEGTEPSPEWTEYTRRVSAGMDASTLIAVPSAAMARSLHEEYGISPEKIRVVHNAARIPESNGKQKEAFVLAAGRMWDKAKNFALLRKIAPDLEWPVRVAGATDEGSDPHGLQMLGVLNRNELAEQMRHASIFAHPSLYEPFGLAPLEAARSRCCLVLSNIPSLRELWDGAAVFLDPRDEESWTFEINELCADFARRQRLAERAAKRARRYNSEATLEGYLHLYSAMLTGEETGLAA